MSRVLSLRLQEGQWERLGRLARRQGRSPGEAGARLIEEGLRAAEFAGIGFRDSLAGRQAGVLGTGLAVWEVALVARAYTGDVSQTAQHLAWPEGRVRAALHYAAAFPEEIEAAIADNAAYTPTAVARLLPQLEVWTVAEGDSAATPGEGGQGEAGRDAAPAAR
jgi:hypothetical protein